MAFVSNRHWNDPALGQAFSNLAAAFAPPSGADAAGWASANAKNAEASRLAALFNYSQGPDYDQARADRMATAAGVYAPSQSYYAVDASNATTRRGQDITSADNRYGYDLQNETSRANNAADNARAAQTNAADNARAIEQTRMGEAGALARLYASPITAAPGETVFLPEQTAAATGLDPMLRGAPKPLSSDETIAAIMAGMPAGDQRQFVRDKFAPSETQVKGEERRRLVEGGLLSEQALLDAVVGAETPVEAIGASGKPLYMSPGEAVRTGAQPAPRSPLVAVNNGPGGDGKLREKLDESEGKRWSDLQGAAATAAGLQGDLEMLSELIDQAPQGPVVGRFNEFFPEATTAGAAFQSIISRAAPGLRTEGSGATSDIEYEGMLKSLPRLRNGPEANRLIVEAMRAKAAINLRRGDIVTAYQNGTIDAATARRQLSELNRQSVLSPGLRSMVDAAGGNASGGTTPAPAAPALQPGTVEGGYRYKGGDPADPANWEIAG